MVLLTTMIIWLYHKYSQEDGKLASLVNMFLGNADLKASGVAERRNVNNAASFIYWQSHLWSLIISAFWTLQSVSRLFFIREYLLQIKHLDMWREIIENLWRKRQNNFASSYHSYGRYFTVRFVVFLAGNVVYRVCRLYNIIFVRNNRPCNSFPAQCNFPVYWKSSESWHVSWRFT